MLSSYISLALAYLKIKWSKSTVSDRPIYTLECSAHLSVSSYNCGCLGVHKNKIPAGLRLGYSQLPRQNTQIRNHIRRVCCLSIFFLLAITDTCVCFPCFPFYICLLFLTELWQGAGEGMTPRNRGQPAVWRRVRDVEMEPLRWQQEIPNAVRYFGCSSALLGCLNSTQHLYPVLAFTFACIDCIMKLVSKVEFSSGSLKELRLGFWKSLNGRLKSSLDFLNVHTQGSIWT